MLFKNMTRRFNEVQENLLNVMEERFQELEGKLVLEMDKKFWELGSKLFGEMESRFVELEKKMEKKMDEKMEEMEERLMKKMNEKIEKMEKKMDEKLEKLEEKLDKKMEQMEARLSTRLDTITEELRRMIGDQQQPKNKTVEDTGSSGGGKSSVTVKDSELGGTMGDGMILKIFPALVAIIFVLTMYKLEWVPRRERRWKLRDEAAATGKKRDGETGNLGCSLM